MPFEFVDGGVKPDRLAQVELIADFVKRVEDLVCPGVVCLVADDGIPQHSVVFEFFAPEAEHGSQSFLYLKRYYMFMDISGKKIERRRNAVLTKMQSIFMILMKLYVLTYKKSIDLCKKYCKYFPKYINALPYGKKARMTLLQNS